MGSATSNWVSRIRLVFWLTLLMGACARAATYAPVVDLNASFSRSKPVKKMPVKQVAAVKPVRHRLIMPSSVMNTQLEWVWPANGRIISVFGEGHKGVNIGGHEKDPVTAATSGKVVYAGDGLRGYGNLIIIKHNNHFLSAYAHNRSLNVKVGDWVKTGQKIAEMGHTGTNKVMLHFEVRKDGKPVNPLLIRGIMNY